MTIAAILKNKGHNVASMRPDQTIAEVAGVLSSRRIGAVVIVDVNEHLVGILSERDIIHAIASQGARALEMNASQIMTREVSTASPQATVHEAMELMTAGRFRHLPVVDQGEMIGLVSIGDVVKARIGQVDQEVDSLKAYVAGVA